MEMRRNLEGIEMREYEGNILFYLACGRGMKRAPQHEAAMSPAATTIPVDNPIALQLKRADLTKELSKEIQVWKKRCAAEGRTTTTPGIQKIVWRADRKV